MRKVLDITKFFVVSVPLACVLYTTAMLISFCKKTIQIFGK